MDGPGIESRWGRDFPHLSRSAMGPTQPPALGYRVFPGVKSGRGVTLTPHPLLMPWSRESRAIPILTLRATPGLYRASVPAQRCTLPYLFFTPFRVIDALDASSITPAQCTLYIYYISIPYFSYMFRCVSQ